MLLIVATHDPESRQAVVFMVNRSLHQAVEVNADVRGIRASSLLQAVTLADADVSATYTEPKPNRIVPKALDGVTLDGGMLCAVLPPVSWSMVRLGL